MKLTLRLIQVIFTLGIFTLDEENTCVTIVFVDVTFKFKNGETIGVTKGSIPTLATTRG